MGFGGNFVDLIIIFFLIVTVLVSFGRGFILLTIELLGFLLALFGALNLYFFPATFLIKYFSVPKAFSVVIGFFIVWVFIETIYYFLARQAVKLVSLSVLRSKFNKILSPLPALANGLAIIAFSLLIIVSLPLSIGFKQPILNSQIGKPIVSKLTSFESPINKVFGEAAQESLTFLTVKSGSHESVNLNFTQKQTSIDSDSEAVMLTLVNEERVKRGISSLEFDPTLREVARSHSQDMFLRGYFSHYSPEGKDVGDRLTAVGVFFLVAGENLAYAPDVQIAHQGLMNSQGHRENILDTQYHKLGVGVVDGGVYGKMFTQVFTN